MQLNYDGKLHTHTNTHNKQRGKSFSCIHIIFACIVIVAIAGPLYFPCKFWMSTKGVGMCLWLGWCTPYFCPLRARCIESEILTKCLVQFKRGSFFPSTDMPTELKIRLHDALASAMKIKCATKCHFFCPEVLKLLSLRIISNEICIMQICSYLISISSLILGMLFRALCTMSLMIFFRSPVCLIRYVAITNELARYFFNSEYNSS